VIGVNFGLGEASHDESDDVGIVLLDCSIVSLLDAGNPIAAHSFLPTGHGTTL